jgi:hypothetical protein
MSDFLFLVCIYYKFHVLNPHFILFSLCSRPILFSPAPFCRFNSLAMCSSNEDGEDVVVENDVGHSER